MDKPFTQEELRKVSKNLKDNKTSGLDAISNEMIECCIDIHGSWFVRLFNSVYQSGCFPLYFKSSTRDDPNNYRDISVNSCLGKLFTLAINSRLTAFLEKNNIIGPNQIGFRKTFRTSDHMFVVKTIMDLYSNKSKKNYACFVDLGL